MPKQSPRDFKERAVRLVTEIRPDHETESSTIGQLATRLGVGPETLRKWVRQAEVNAGLRLGVSESENAEIRRLKKEVTELRRTNEILRTASLDFSGQHSSDLNLSAELSKLSVFLGLELSRVAMLSRSARGRCFMLTPLESVDATVDFSSGATPLRELPHWRRAKSWIEGGEAPRTYVEYKESQHKGFEKNLDVYVNRWHCLVLDKLHGRPFDYPVMRCAAGRLLRSVNGVQLASV